MTAAKTPNVPLLDNAPRVTKELIPGVGETETREWTGERTDIEDKYSSLKTDVSVGGLTTGDVTRLTTIVDRGRSLLRVSYDRATNGLNSTNTRIVEELYAVDIIRDVSVAPYFNTGGDAALTDDEVIAVKDAVENNLKESEISDFGSWIAAQKELKYLMLHGQESYMETGFILRQSLFGVITSQIKASYDDINTVVSTPVFESDMDALIESLPDGEWIYKPPQAEHMGGGKWRISKEWHWATKWSIVYGGTFTYDPQP